MNKKSKVILTSCATIALSASLIAGSTFALFTHESKTNIAVTSGKVKVTATIVEESLTTYSYETIGVEETLQVTNGTWVNGGTATIKGQTLEIENITPGDKVTFDIKIDNDSNVAIKYRTKVSYTGDYSQYKLLDVQFDGEQSTWKYLDAKGKIEAPVEVSIELPEAVENEGQDMDIDLVFAVEAVQGNANVEDPTFDLPAGPEEGKTQAEVNGYTLLEEIANAKEGDKIVAPEGTYACDALAINTKGLTLTASGDVTITAPVTINADNVTISGISLYNESGRTVNVLGDNFTMDGCDVQRTQVWNQTGRIEEAYGEYGALVSISSSKATITNSTLVSPYHGDTNDIDTYSLTAVKVWNDGADFTMENSTIATNGYAFMYHMGHATLKNVTFCGLEGYKAAEVAGDVTTLYMAINSTVMNGVTLDGCTIKDARSYGMLAGGSLTVKNSMFTNVQGTHIYFGWGTTENVELTGNTFDLSTGYGPRFISGSLVETSQVKIDGNTFMDLAKNENHNNRLIMNDCEKTIEATNCKIVNCPEEYQNNKNVIINGAVTHNVADGDQLVALLAQLKAEQPAHKTILKLSAGTYSASGNDQFRVEADNVHIVGEAGTVIDADNYACSGQAAFGVSGDNCSIENVTIKSESTTGDVAVLKITKLDNESDIVKNFKLSNVTLEGALGHGLNLHGVDGAEIDGLNVTSYGKCAIALAKATNVTFTKLTTASAGWGFDIGYMYGANAEQEAAYVTHCANVTLNLVGSSLGNGKIYSERPTASWDGTADEVTLLVGEGSDNWTVAVGDTGAWAYTRA